MSKTIELTNREKDVLRLLVKGKGNAEIAKKLDLGVASINSYVHNTLKKTGCKNRTELALWGLDNSEYWKPKTRKKVKDAPISKH